jgi:ABC-2 type transport system ATP-binding protein
MRCEIAASLLHDPKILFLDEPTIGLDAVSKIAVREFIQRINREKGTTVILTTHDMQDIEALTERILLIGKGRILLDGPLAQLKSRNSKKRTITLDYISGGFQPEEGITLVSRFDGRAVFAVDTEILSVSSAIERLSRSAEIKDLSVAGPTAEEMVVSLYEEFQI